MNRGGIQLSSLVWRQRCRWRSSSFDSVSWTSTLPERQTISRNLQSYSRIFHNQFVVVSSSARPTLVDLKVHFGPDVGETRMRLHTGLVQFNDSKPSSKIEETVIRLKKKKEEEKKSEAEALSDINAVISTDLTKKEDAKPVPVEPKKSLWVRFVNELKHYYSGFKLLFLDVRICSKIIWKVLQGNTLTRRENKQLVRTVGDLFRLVPFSVFIIVPFMEFLLPVALKLFPGMLPSTFTTTSERETKMKRTLTAKLEYAKFLQKTLDEMSLSSSQSRNSKSARDFVQFYKQVKGNEIQVKNKEILKFSQLFKDEITLDNMTRAQLVALCRLLELTPMGTNNFLQFQLEMKLRQLKSDDKVIQREGVENMDVQELQTACKERGMRALGLSEKQLQRQLGQWLDLSLNENVPPSLLLLSRTLYLPEDLAPTAQIAATISSLPEAAATQTSADIGEKEGKIRNEMRLEIIKEEQRKIEEEAKAAQELQQTVELKKLAEAVSEDVIKVALDPKAALSGSEALKKEISVPPRVEKLITEAVGHVKKATVAANGDMQAKSEELKDKAPVLEDPAEVEMVVETDKERAKASQAEKISPEDLTDLKQAILSLGKVEKEDKIGDIEELKKELKDYVEDVEDLKFIRAEAGRFDLQESKGAKRLFSMVNRMLGKVDHLVASLEEKEKALAAKIKEDDGKETKEQEENLVSIHELIEAVQKLRKTSDSTKVEQIANVLSRMDVDSDGIIKVDHVMKVIELLGKESINLSGKEVDHIVDLLAREEMLAVEADIEETLGKSPPDEELDKEKMKVKSEESNTNNDTRTVSRVDMAQDLTEQEPEKHIQEMFSSPDQKKKEKAEGSKKASDHDDGPMNLK